MSWHDSTTGNNPNIRVAILLPFVDHVLRDFFWLQHRLAFSPHIKALNVLRY